MRLGADGKRGSLIAVFTGATVGFGTAVQQVRGLVLDGYRVSFVLSEAAERIYASVLKDQMAGFPHVTWLEPGRWLPALNEARAVVVPLLSANTLSKISLLIADTLAGNVILHALFMGKKVIAARNGADPAGSGRDKIGFNRGSAPLQRALLERFGVVEDYGCHMTDVAELRSRVNLLLSQVEKLTCKTRESAGRFRAFDSFLLGKGCHGSRHSPCPQPGSGPGAVSCCSGYSPGS